LHSQFTHALQHVSHLAQRAFSRLCQRDAIVGIARGHAQATHLGVHALCDGQTGGIVLALLTRRPDDRRCMVVFSELPERVRFRCALIEAILVLIVAAIAVPLVKGRVASHRY
jgi:hypothetical protein